MERQDWLILVLARGGSLSPVQIQKALFLLGREAPEAVADSFYNFQPYDYGPFDASIYTDAFELQAQGLVAIENPASRGWRRYSLTGDGQEKAQGLEAGIDEGTLVALSSTLSWVKRQSFSDLVRTIYENYPEFKVNSVFRG